MPLRLLSLSRPGTAGQMDVRPSLYSNWTMRLLAYLQIILWHPILRRLRSGAVPLIFAGACGSVLLRLLVPMLVFVAFRRVYLLDTPAVALPDPELLVQSVAAYSGPVIFVLSVARGDERPVFASPYVHLPLSSVFVRLVDEVRTLLRLPALCTIAMVLGLGAGVVASSEGPDSGRSWIAAVLSSCVLGYGLGTWIRRKARSQIVPLSIGAVLLTGVLFDHTTGGGMGRAVAPALTEPSIWSGPGALILLAAGTLVVLLSIARSAVRSPDMTPVALTRLKPNDSGRFVHHLVLGCLIVEVRLLLRCKYPRYVLRGIGGMSLFILLLALVSNHTGSGLVSLVFVIGGLPVAYSQLAFAWNSPHFDGLMLLPIRADDHVRARVLLAVVLATLMLFVSVPVVVIAPALHVPDLLAAYVFVTGFLAIPCIAGSMRWSRSVRLDTSGLSNLRAYSWPFYVGGFTVWYGIAGLAALTSEATARFAIAATGAAGMLMFPTGIQVLHRRLSTNLIEMADRLRLPA